MTENKCFALKPHRHYYVSNTECYALAYPAYRRMLREGRCGTMQCPFYKPHRLDLRCGDEIKQWKRKEQTNDNEIQVSK